MKKLVSVIMSVHNEKREYIKCSINSICNQTYPYIEFIIIDDASDNDCSTYLKELCESYKNIKLIRNTENLGLTITLNKGLQIAKGEYIARMDADDYSFPHRIEKQVLYLEQHSDVDIIGTGVISFGQRRMFMSPMQGLSVQQAKCELFFTSTLCHPSIMMRKAFVDKTGIRYDEKIKKAQDYDLWERSSVLGNIAVMPEVLLLYRLHSDQITSKNKKEQEETANKVRKRRLQRIGIVPSDNEYQCHLMLAGEIRSSAKLTEIQNWINKICTNNAIHTIVENSELKRNFGKRLCLLKLKSLKLNNFSLSDFTNLLAILKNRFEMYLLLRKYGKIILKLQKEEIIC